MDDLGDHQAEDSSSNEDHQLLSQLKGQFKQRETARKFKTTIQSISSKERVTSNKPPTYIISEEPVPLSTDLAILRTIRVILRALVVRALKARVVTTHETLDVGDVIIIVELDGGLEARLVSSLDLAEDLQDLVHSGLAVNLDKEKLYERKYVRGNTYINTYVEIRKERGKG